MNQASSLAHIRPIDSTAVDRIVAGQAVTDLASCVKELVDNALDAGSKTINSKWRYWREWKGEFSNAVSHSLVCSSTVWTGDGNHRSNRRWLGSTSRFSFGNGSPAYDQQNRDC